MVSGGFRPRRSGSWYTNWRRDIAYVKWGMDAWSRTGLEATIILIVSFLRAKALSFELEHNSTVSWHSCSPAYYKARNFGYVWCTASGRILITNRNLLIHF